MPHVTRFAPGPTGLLHLGHAYAALTAERAADGGRFLLRIEDLDTARARPDCEAAIFEDLAWLGLRWETPVWRQSERQGAYRDALDRLRGEGLLYQCFCTRRDIAAEIARAAEAPHGPDGPVYPGLCRALDAAARARKIEEGAVYAWRLDGAAAAARTGALTFREHGRRRTVDPRLFGDVVLGRKDAPASYHLAVVVDDAAQGVTLVTRGEDLLPAVPVQRLLQALLGLPAPDYAHHRLVTDETGRRLAKRDGARAIRNLREAGASADEVRRLAGFH